MNHLASAFNHSLILSRWRWPFLKYLPKAIEFHFQHHTTGFFCRHRKIMRALQQKPPDEITRFAKQIFFYRNNSMEVIVAQTRTWLPPNHTCWFQAHEQTDTVCHKFTHLWTTLPRTSQVDLSKSSLILGGWCWIEEVTQQTITDWGMCSFNYLLFKAFHPQMLYLRDKIRPMHLGKAHLPALMICYSTNDFPARGWSNWLLLFGSALLDYMFWGCLKVFVHTKCGVLLQCCEVLLWCLPAASIGQLWWLQSRLWAPSSSLTQKDQRYFQNFWSSS